MTSRPGDQWLSLEGYLLVISYTFALLLLFFGPSNNSEEQVTEENIFLFIYSFI